MKKLLTVKELEKIFQVTRQTIFDWRKKGLPYKKVGRLVRFEKSEVEIWIEDNNK